jgi:subfamily B ATP-binding cassette protein MsbA
MNTYFRVLSYAKSYNFLPIYIFCVLLSIVFSTVNFTMLIPLLQVLFETIPADLQKYSTYPSFSLSINYLKDLFNYYFAYMITNYGKMSALQYVCAILCIITIVANIFRYLANNIINRVKVAIVSNLRYQLYQHINELHYAYFTNERKGDLVARITIDVQEVEWSLVNSIKQVFIEPLKIITYFTLLLYTSWELTLFSIIFLPISGTIISQISQKLKKDSKETQHLMGHLLGIVEETLFGLKIIRAFNANNYIGKKFYDVNQRYSDVSLSIENRKEMASPVSEVMSVFVVIGLLLYGGSMVVRGDADLKAPQFMTYILIFSQILQPAKFIAGLFSSIPKGVASAQRVFAVLDTVPAIQDKPQCQHLTEFKDRISFQNVTFSYGDKTVLKNLSFDIPKGKTIALVGASGGGKSTIADLIPRFYDVEKGEILIDGEPIRNFSQTSLRNLMGVVTQESILFNDTIYNNIAFGVTNTTQTQIEEAAKIANAHEFIVKTELSYQTPIGDRGVKLSGGQRQRLSIARAVLKNPPILILDEATSALDTESEKLVQEALTNLMQNRTVLVIAHRLSTIQHADEILVLKEGEIIERGTHEQLLENSGVYKKLIEMQGY